MKRKILTLLTLTFIGFENVNIPDANFKAYLLTISELKTPGSSEITVAKAQAFTGVLFCVSKNISDLTGIEAFVNITYLNCAQNQLTSLDVSSNTALKRVWM